MPFLHVYENGVIEKWICNVLKLSFPLSTKQLKTNAMCVQQTCHVGTLWDTVRSSYPDLGPRCNFVGYVISSYT